MNGQEYLQQLEQRLAHYYDKKPLPKAPAFVLAAELNAADEGYFIVPSLKTYSVQHNEYLYAAHFDKKLTAAMADLDTESVFHLPLPSEGNESLIDVGGNIRMDV